jgi:nitrate reductase NapE component
VQWPLLLIGLEFPAVLSLVDCINRPDDDFLGGAEDKRAWIRWLVIAVITVPILLGYGIVLGYYFTVVKRSTPGRQAPSQDDIDTWRNEQQNR